MTRVLKNKSTQKFFPMSWVILAMIFIWSSAYSEVNPELNQKVNIQLDVEKYQLKNGMTVLLYEDHSIPIISFHQWFRVGSKDEKPGLTGLAHFFEHLMFKGSKKYPNKAFDKELKKNGGTNNAFTSFDYTGYFENFPSDKLEFIIDAESDRMVNLIFKQSDIDSERGVVKEERRMRTENSIEGAMWEAVGATVFKVHPYRFPVIGSMVDLNRASIDDMKAFYKTYYAPNNAVIVVAGDFDKAEAKKIIEKKYAHIPSQPIPKRTYPQEPPQKGQRNTILRKNVQNPYLSVAFKAPKGGDPEAYAFDLLSTILGEGDSSRLHKRMVYKEQIASSVSAYAYTPQEPGFFEVFALGKPGVNIERLQKSIFAELYRLRKHLVTEKELQKAKNKIMFSYVNQLKTIYGKASALARSEILYGDYSFVFKDINKYMAVTREQILEVSKKYLMPEQRSLIKVLPKTKSQEKKVAKNE